jgi:hypothetical protein
MSLPCGARGCQTTPVHSHHLEIPVPHALRIEETGRPNLLPLYRPKTLRNVPPLRCDISPTFFLSSDQVTFQSNSLFAAAASACQEAGVGSRMRKRKSRRKNMRRKSTCVAEKTEWSAARATQIFEIVLVSTTSVEVGGGPGSYYHAYASRYSVCNTSLSSQNPSRTRNWTTSRASLNPRSPSSVFHQKVTLSCHKKDLSRP